MTGNDLRVSEPWHALVVVAALVLAYCIPRYALTPEGRPWQIWIPTGAACALLIAALIMRGWLVVIVFGLVVPIDVWRTLPTWRALRGRDEVKPERRIG